MGRQRCRSPTRMRSTQTQRALRREEVPDPPSPRFPGDCVCDDSLRLRAHRVWRREDLLSRRVQGHDDPEQGDLRQRPGTNVQDVQTHRILSAQAPRIHRLREDAGDAAEAYGYIRSETILHFGELRLLCREEDECDFLSYCGSDLGRDCGPVLYLF